jgi:hypothetical protein
MTADPGATSELPGLDGLLAAWTAMLRPIEPGGGPVELATRLLDPRHWLGVGGAVLEQPFETVLGLPRLADVPDLDRKMLSLLLGWLGVSQRGAEYAAGVAEVWITAFGEFLAVVQAAAVAGKTGGNGRELLDRWTAIVNEQLLKAQRSDSFLEAQRRLLDALLTSRAAERELVEVWAKAAGLPTRAEIDDMHRTLHTVKRELRALQLRLAAAEEAAAAARNRLKVVAGGAGGE